MIQHKVRAVPDSVCKGCLQHWEGECRAFEAPHSEEERAYRNLRRFVPGAPLPCVVWQRSGRTERKWLNSIDVETILLLVGVVVVILLLVQMVP